ncbi:MAG: ImuA family protein [Rhizobiaceae bacterium]
MNIIKTLQHSLHAIDGTRERLVVGDPGNRLRLGIPDIDILLGDGLALNDLHEVRCSLSRDIGTACGFMLGLLCRIEKSRPVIWIAEPSVTPDTGTLYPDGFEYFGFDSSRLVHVQSMHLKDALWAAGEVTKAGSLAASVFQVAGNPEAFDLSVSRKLMLRSQKSGVPLFILRQAGREEASSAATRWHVKPSPSLQDENFSRGLGNMRLTLTLEKNRNGQTGQWVIAWNPQTRSFEHAAQSSSAAYSQLPLATASHRPHRPSSVGQILAPDWAKRQASG